MEQYLLLVSLGLAIGVVGTLIGAGGGFILMPILLVLYPHENPELLTSTSLAVVFFNALSGSIAYARMKRIDYKSGLLFSAASIPGAILGAITTEYIPRILFNVIFGVVMILASGFLMLKPERRGEKNEGLGGSSVNVPMNYSKPVGSGLSVVVGFLSSVLGIGGGIIHVPALIHILQFPVHAATATSHFILAIMSFTGTAVHIASGAFAHGVYQTVSLASGALVGAQVGARLSNRVHGKWIVRGLAIALAILGIRLLLTAL